MARAKIATLVIAALALISCRHTTTLTVGSKNFTEQMILGELLAQHIENRLGIPVERRLNLGGTLLAHQALTAGELDLYAEYTGTALMAILHFERKLNPSEVFATVAEEYRRRWNLIWFPPFGFNDTFAVVVREDDAAQWHLRTITDAVRTGRSWRLGMGFEFQQRPDGLQGFLKTYPLKLEDTPVAMDLGLLYRAQTEGKVDMIVVNSTDGLLIKLPVVVLEDDRQYFPPYQAAPVVRADALERFPGLEKALRELANTIDNATMQQLNYLVDAENRRPAEVARQFLQKLYEKR